MKRQIELAKRILENSGYDVKAPVNEALKSTYVIVRGNSPDNGVCKIEATSDEDAKRQLAIYVQGKPRALAQGYRVVKDRPEYTAYQDLEFINIEDYESY